MEMQLKHPAGMLHGARAHRPLLWEGIRRLLSLESERIHQIASRLERADRIKHGQVDDSLAITVKVSTANVLAFVRNPLCALAVETPIS